MTLPGSSARAMQPRRRLWIALAAAGLAAALGAGIAISTAGGGSKSSSKGASATIIASEVGAPTAPRSLTSFSAFRARRRPIDALPASLRSDANKLATTKAGGLGPAHLSQSRLLTQSDNSGQLYAWPTGANGICIGVTNVAVRCLRDFPSASALGPSLIYATSARGAVVAGMVADSVKSVRLTTPAGATCVATTADNGFTCRLSTAQLPKHLRVRLTLADGRTPLVTLP